MKGLLRKCSSIFLALCMVITMLPGNMMLETVKAADAAFGTLQNGALTANADGWTIEGIEADTNYNFSNGYLSIWTGDEGKTVSVSQTIENVKAGSYVVSFAAVGNDGKANMKMVVENLTTETAKEVTVVPDGWDNWDNILTSEELTVSDGDNVKISFTGELESNEWYGYKNVAFTNTVVPEFGTLINGALTANADGWTVSGVDFDEAGKLNQGYSFKDGYLSIYTEEANEGVDVSVSQTIENVEVGSYVVSFAAVGNNGKNNMKMVVENLTAKTFKEVTVVPDGWDNWDNVLSSDAIDAAEGDNLKITFMGNLVGKEWYGYKNVTLTNKATTIDAPITVAKVDNLSKDFIHGVDISTYMSEVQSGVKYYDENGEEQNMFKIFQDAGVNYVRLRVWNCPFRVDDDGNYIYVDEAGQEYSADLVDTNKDENGFNVYTLKEGGKVVYREGYGAGNCDIETATAIAKIAQEYGMKVLIDFHYSDFWADPGKFAAPKAWADMDLETKTTALANYTTECLTKLKEAGVTVSMVQVGNEINGGMAGESNEDKKMTLIKAGCEAVRAFDKNILIAIHYADPHKASARLGNAKTLDEKGIDYDVFASSYYPFWHGSLENLTSMLKTIADTYHKKVMVAEISYAWTLEDGDGASNVVNENTDPLPYSIDAEGQAAAVRDAIAAVSAVGEAGIGTFYWEAAWIPAKNHHDAEDKENVLNSNIANWQQYGSGWATQYVGPDYDNYDKGVAEDLSTHGSQWDNQGFFDFDGNVLPSINVYKYVYTGADGPVKVDSIDTADVTMGYGETPELPQTTNIHLNDGNTVENVTVKWNAEDIAKLEASDFGIYTIKGDIASFSFASKGDTITTKEGQYKMVANVKITGENVIPNGDFEDGEEGWILENARLSTDTSNAYSGKNYIDAWVGDGELNLKAEKTFDAKNVQAGQYMLMAYYQGTNIETVFDDSELYIILTYENGQTRSYKTNDVQIPNVWQMFHQAKVKAINVNEHVTGITVGTKLHTSAGWGVADSFQLMKYADADAGDAEFGKGSSVSENQGPEKPKPEQPKPELPKVGTEKNDGKVTVKVISSTEQAKEVVFVGATNKKAKTVTIPATVKIDNVEYKVTAIADNAFKNNKSVKTIKVPDTVTQIGKSAFSGCTKLKAVTVPAGIKTIGAKAFYNCKELKKITIKSKTVTSIGKNAFKKINPKATIKVPKGKKKAYAKLLKKAGVAKTVKVK